MVKTAIILAAGNGRRLAGDTSGPAPSKPLTQLAGVPLVIRTLLALQRSGFERAVVVTGYRAEEVEAALTGDSRLQLEVVFARNEQWRAGNGVSALAARPYVQAPEFYLLMSDHVFDRQILALMAQAPLDPQGALLAVDRKLGEVFDMDDATKVLTDTEGKVVRIGKQLDLFDAVDTGIFRCTHSLFEKLAEVYERKGDCSLSDGIGYLASRGRMHTLDVGDAWWQDVDTPGSMRHAQGLLLRQSLSTPDGISVPGLVRRLPTLPPPAQSPRPRARLH